jgi:tRNA(fMet)-specific endonuclease VapC
LKYLLDTNACIVYLRQRNARLTRRVDSHPFSDMVLCSIVVGELFHGAEKSANPPKNRAIVEGFVQPFHSLPHDDSSAREYAIIRFDLESRGQRIGDYDMLIAAIARSNNLTLVTHNTAEFSRIPNLSVEDWEIP